jgi:hypothetical protein
LARWEQRTSRAFLLVSPAVLGLDVILDGVHDYLVRASSGLCGQDRWA